MAWRGGPPAEGSASSYGGVKFTATDIESLADGIGVPFEGDAFAAAGALADVLDWYVIAARIQGTRSERATASEWGNAVAAWATEGRVLLGDDRREVVQLTRASIHLCNALPPFGAPEEANLTSLMFQATGLYLSDDTNSTNNNSGQTRAAVVASLIQQTAYALRALQTLGRSVKPNGAEKGKQIDHARLALIRNMSRIFFRTFPNNAVQCPYPTEV